MEILIFACGSRQLAKPREKNLGVLAYSSCLSLKIIAYSTTILYQSRVIITMGVANVGKIAGFMVVVMWSPSVSQGTTTKMLVFLPALNLRMAGAQFLATNHAVRMSDSANYNSVHR